MSKARAINSASLIVVTETLCRAMKVYIQSRSGKDLIPGGIEITDKVGFKIHIASMTSLNVLQRPDCRHPSCGICKLIAW